MMGKAAASFEAIGVRDWIVTVTGWLDRFPLSVLLLVFRFSIGSVFWHAGLTKIASWQTTIVLFQNEYKVPLLPPELAAYMATTVELTCPVLLVLGLAARLVTLPMLAQTFVIEAFVYPAAYPVHGPWAVCCLVIMIFGPGFLSLDTLVARMFSRK